MTRSSLPVRLLVALVSVVLLLGACAADPPAATIGDERLTDEELDAEVALFRFLTALSGAPCGTPVQGETQEAACSRFTLTNLIQEEVVLSYAVGRGVEVDDAEVRDAIDRLEENLGGAAELDTRLEAEGVTRDQLHALATRLLLFGAVQDAVVEERLDEGALEEAYEQQQGQFTTLEVSHILVETEEEAREIADRATTDNFGRLARQRSQDTGSAEGDGNLGTYSESEFLSRFDADFAAAALALEPGGISGPVQTQFGWHVIWLLRRDVAAFEDVRDQLVEQQGVAEFEEWLRERYEELDIEVNPRYGRLDPDTREVVPVRSTAEDPEGPTAAGP